MTPPPAAAASRSAARSSTSGSRRGAVRHHRRVSGSVSGSSSAAAAAAIPLPGIALPGRRPAPVRTRKPARARTRPRQAAATRGLALRAIDLFEEVSGSAVLDRIARGRLWIGLLAFALVGIVAMQLMVLKLNTGIGATITREATLERDNAQLNVENSMSSGEERVAPLAAASGMTLASAGTVHFLVAGPAYVKHAATALSSALQAPSSSSTTAGGEAEASSTASSEGEGSSEPEASSSEAEASASSEASTNDGESSSDTESEAPAEGTPSSSEAESSSESSAGESVSSSTLSGPGGGTEAGE